MVRKSPQSLSDGLRIVFAVFESRPPGGGPSGPTNTSPAPGASEAWSLGDSNAEFRGFQRTERVSLVRPFYDRLMAVRSHAERRVKRDPRGALTLRSFFELDLLKKEIGHQPPQP
jgi:hypothetical protein